MTESPETRVLTEIDGRGVATVTLNRADKHNAFDDAIIAELDSSFARLALDPAVRAVVLASTGKSFSAGADLAWMQRMAGYDHHQNLKDARALAEMLRKLNHLPQPDAFFMVVYVLDLVRYRAAVCFAQLWIGVAQSLTRHVCAQNF